MFDNCTSYTLTAVLSRNYTHTHTHTYLYIYSFLCGKTVHIGPRLPRCLGCRSHKIRHTHTSGMNSLNECPAPSRGQYLHNITQTNIHALSGIHTCDTSKNLANTSICLKTMQSPVLLRNGNYISPIHPRE